MGIMDWFSSEEKPEEEEIKENVRYLCDLEKEYGNMEEFMEDFFDILNQTIERYNESNPVKAEKLDREKVRKKGGNWVYEANIEKPEEELETEEAERMFGGRKKSTFKVIAREQPDYSIEFSGNKGLISPFVEEIKGVLTEKGMEHNVVVIGKPGLGKAQ